MSLIVSSWDPDVPFNIAAGRGALQNDLGYGGHDRQDLIAIPGADPAIDCTIDIVCPSILYACPSCFDDLRACMATKCAMAAPIKAKERAAWRRGHRQNRGHIYKSRCIRPLPTFPTSSLQASFSPFQTSWPTLPTPGTGRQASAGSRVWAPARY